MSKFWAASDSDSDSASGSPDDNSNDDESVDWDDDDESDDEIGAAHSIPAETADTIDIDIDIDIDNERQQPEMEGEHFSAKAALENTKDDPLDANLKWTTIQADQVFAEVPTSNSATEREPNVTRIVCMSDTHARHRDIPFLPRGDVFIHGGDFTKSGEIGTVQDISAYFAEHSSQFEQIICIAGNHEITFQPEFYETSRRRHKPKPFDPYETRAALKNCTYLEDSGTFIGGNNDIEVYGSPWTVAFYDWAFNLPRGEALNDVWCKVPSSTDVLITHGPPLGRGDFTDHSGRAGCYDLLQQVQHRIKPRLHIFGHIHSSHGYSFDGQTLFVNASNLNSDTEIASRPCIVVDVPHDKFLPARIVQPCCKVQTTGELLEWLEEKDYNLVVGCVSSSQRSNQDWLQQAVPLPEAFSEESAFFDLCGILGLYRDTDAQTELRRAICQLYAESFP